MPEMQVYTGLWVDRDKSPVLGATLTVTNTQANYLMSFLSFLITTVVASSIWKILIFCLYHIRSLPTDTEPTIDQPWVVLRNSKSAFAAAIDLLKPYFPTGDNGTRGEPRLLVKLLLPAIAVILVQLGGVALPPLIASDSSSEIIVLSKAGNCGFLLGVSTSFEDLDAKTVAAITARELQETTDGRQYATERYGNATSTLSTKPMFPSVVLPFTIDRSAPCPFSEEMCLLGPNSAISFDTGLLDSHIHLGINAPPRDRVQYRWKSTCSPLKLDMGTMVEIVKNKTVDGFPVSDTDNLVHLYLGGDQGKNYTISWQQQILDPGGYQVRTTSATNGITTALSWNATDSLNRTDADLSLVFIAPNFVVYAEKVFDPVFQANGTKQDATDKGMWLSDWTFRFLACAEQHQYCDPNTGSCTEMEGTAGDAFKPFINDGITQQFATATRLYSNAVDHYIERSVNSLGRNALIAHSVVPDHYLVSPGLPENQWQLETQRWFETGLAKFQFKAVEFVDVRFTDSEAVGFRPTLAQNYSSMPELNAALVSQCSTQRIRSTGQVQNFSVLGISALVGVAVIIGALDCVLEQLGRLLSAKDKTALWDRDGLLSLWGTARPVRSPGKSNHLKGDLSPSSGRMGYRQVNSGE